MSGLCCAICGEPYFPHNYDHLFVCLGCLPNLAASVDRSRPEILGVDEDLATRLLLEQTQECSLTLSPRQVHAMARLTRRWQARAPDAGADAGPFPAA